MPKSGCIGDPNLTQLLIGKRSLSEKQITDAFEKFRVCIRLLKIGSSPQLKKNISSDFISYSFVKKSESYSVQIPTISISTKQYCKNLENVKTVEISVHNCTQCRGSDSAEITSRKYSSLATILTDAFAIWHKSYKENLSLDIQAVKDENNLKHLKKLFHCNTKKIKKDRWSDTLYFVDKRRGRISTDDDKKSKFEISLCNLSYSDMSRLSKILSSFLKEESE